MKGISLWFRLDQHLVGDWVGLCGDGDEELEAGATRQAHSR